MTAVADYVPIDSQDATNVCERVVPRLQHANGSVVLAAIKVNKRVSEAFVGENCSPIIAPFQLLLVYIPYIEDEEFVRQVQKKMTPPLGNVATLII